MSNFSNPEVYEARKLAAAAGTLIVGEPVGNRPVFIKGWGWLYEAAEANADNTLDFAIEYTTDGVAYTTIFVNGNANGLLDTSAVLLANNLKGSAAAPGGAAVAQSFSPIRVPANATIRFTVVTAGTGTIPGVVVYAYGSPA